MKILHLSKFYYPRLGGIELVAKMMVRAQAESNKSVIVVAFDSENKTENGTYKEKIIRLKQHFFLLSTPFNFSFFFHFKKLILEEKIDRIYVHLPNPLMHEILFWYQWFLKKNKIKICGVYHSDIVGKGILGFIYHKYFQFTSTFYDELLVSSKNLWNSSNVLKNINQNKMRILPFCPEPQPHFRIREKFNNKALSIGRLVPYKGFEFLISALKGEKLEVKIVGDGPLKPILSPLTGQNISILSSVSETDKMALFDSVDLLIVSSISNAEAYGMTITEAFEQGIPVLASNLPTGVTFLADNTRGGIFDVGNQDQLKRLINRYYEDENLIKVHSMNARDFYLKNLSFESFKKTLNEIENSLPGDKR